MTRQNGTYTVAPYDLQGTQSDARWDGYEMSWDYVSQYGSSGIWTSSGSGTGQGAVGDRTDRSASGAVTQGSVTGTYDEGSNTYNNFGYDLTLDMTNWQWTMGGSGSGIGNGGSHKNLDLQDSNWSASAHGGNVVGTGSETLDGSTGNKGRQEIKRK